jgi:DNA replicative helicase MCM subunit Mcm2 (Cdc46/Mcm family)
VLFHVGQLIAVSGTVIRTGTVKMLEYSKEYQCGKCKLFPSLCVRDLPLDD